MSHSMARHKSSRGAPSRLSAALSAQARHRSARTATKMTRATKSTSRGTPLRCWFSAWGWSRAHVGQQTTRLVIGLGLLTAVVALGLGMSRTTAVSAHPRAPLFQGSVASAQVHSLIDLHNPVLHPGQLVYDTNRNGLWFWTSTQQGGTTFENQVYFYDIVRSHLTAWPIYSGDWSSQVLSGVAVAPNGDIWIGWNRNLIDFHPATGTYTRYVLSPQPQFPLPAQVTGDLPTNLGIADLAVDRSGTVWIARAGALSLTAFSPESKRFHEYPLPLASGDPAKLAIGPDGSVSFTTDLAANHPGYGAETVGVFDPHTDSTQVYTDGAQALAFSPQGDLYTVQSGIGLGLARVTAAEQQAASQAHRAPTIQHWVASLNVDDRAVAVDRTGRIWMAVAGQPMIAVLTPATGELREYTYAAPSIAAHPVTEPDLQSSSAPSSSPAQAVWVTPIVAMATDSQGHLWYIRGGSDVIEEVAA